MPKRKDTPCTKCGALTWWNSKSSRPKNKIVCHPCRRTDPATRPGRTVPLAEQLQRMAAGRFKLHDKTCPTCNLAFRAVSNRVYCDRCKEQRLADRLRRKNVTRRGVAADGERVTIDQLGDECAWLCWICGGPVDRTLRNKDPQMPSYDHVLPISRGGTDRRDNLRLAHLTCNVRRGNRIM